MINEAYIKEWRQTAPWQQKSRLPKPGDGRCCHDQVTNYAPAARIGKMVAVRYLLLQVSGQQRSGDTNTWPLRIEAIWFQTL